MSVNLMSAIFETEFFDLKDENGNTTKASTAKLVLLAMADHANDEGEGAYPSVERLCRKTALSEQTIRNTFDALRYNGIIFLAGQSKYRTNNHTINVKSFPKAIGKEITTLTLYPLDPLTGNDIGSNGLPYDPLPVIPESSLTIKKSSRKTDETKGQYNIKGIEAAMYQDRPVTSDDLPEWEAREKAACDAFESAFGIDRPWNWYPAKSTQENEWAELRAYLVQLYEADNTCFVGYATWANDKYSRGAKNASQIRQDPGAFPTAWACYKTSGMYTNKSSNDENRTSLLRTL